MSSNKYWVLLVIGCVFSLLAYSLDVDPEYEEIFVSVRVQSIGSFEMNALYSYNANQLLIPIVDLFQYLNINHEVSRHFDSISGFLIDENKRYIVSHSQQLIRVDGVTIQLKAGDLLKTESGLFLNTALFGRAFGLFCTFHFRSLSVEVKTDLNLPAIRELRLKQMRRNIERLKGRVEVDTVIERQYHLLKFGMIDWGISATQINGKDSDTRAAISLGAELFGGETNIFLNYSTRDSFIEQNQQYFWRWANNNRKSVRQVRVGKVIPSSISSLFNPVIGASITNTPTTFRRSFGEYTLADFTEPGWTVELYINNVIVDYLTADASGFYSFNVPLVYGTSQIILKFYGPYGEERTREQYLSIPYNFLPKGELEYNITGGMVQDGDQSIYSRAILNYGVNRFLTVGGGMEYLSSIKKGPEIPFLAASITPIGNLLLSGEYAHGVRTRALLSYRLPSNLMLEFDYANYDEGQQALYFNYLQERKATFAIPFRFSDFRGYARISYKQNIYSLLNYNTADALFSTHYKRISANLSGYASWVDQRSPFVYSNLALGFRFGRGFTFRPQLQYDISNQEIISFKIELEKRINNSGYFSVSYEENSRMAYRSVDFLFRWDLSFAQANLGSRISREAITTTQGARGSMAFGSGNKYTHKSNRSNIGRGGITIIPFLDVNHNGIRDDGEPLAAGLNIRINGGRIVRNIHDTLTRVTELEPYASYLIELDDTGLDNIAWRIKHKVISVYVDPNQFKHIDVPVLPMGEVNGMVWFSDGKTTRGLGRILVNFHHADGTYVTRTLTESVGSLTYLGLAPGEYYAEVDPEQLTRLSLSAEPKRIKFSIIESTYGDIVDGIDFTLYKPDEKDDSINNSERFEEIRIQMGGLIQEPEPKPLQVEENPDILFIASKPDAGKFYVQAGAFASLLNATLLQKELALRIDYHFEIITEDGLHKVRAGIFQSREMALECLESLEGLGIKAFIGKLHN